MDKSNKASISLKARDVIKRKNKQIRRNGQVPAVIYGPNRKSTNVQVDVQAALDLIRSTTGSSIITLDLDGTKTNAFLSEVQTNPRNNLLTHLSFFEPDQNKKIIVEVPLTATGIAPAVKNNLGILFLPIAAIPVRGLPKDVVEQIEVDVTGLAEIGAAIQLQDIKLPAGLEIAHEEDKLKTAITITAFQKEIVEEEVVATPVEGEAAAEGDATTDTAEGEGEAAAEGAEGEKK